MKNILCYLLLIYTSSIYSQSNLSFTINPISFNIKGVNINEKGLGYYKMKNYTKFGIGGDINYTYSFRKYFSIYSGLNFTLYRHNSYIEFIDPIDEFSKNFYDKK